MNKSVHSLHRLPVLNFDVDSIDRKTTLKGISSNYKYIDVNEKITNESKYEVRKKSSKIIPKLHRKTKVQKPDNQLRRTSANVNVNNIKQTLSSCTNYVNQILLNTNFTAHRKNKIKNHKDRKITKKIDLYTAESRKFNKRSKRKKTLIDEIYDVKQNYYNDKLDFMQELQNEKYLQQNSKNYEASKKLNQCYSRQNLALKRTPTNLRCDNMHFNVIDFPNFDCTDTEVEAINLNKERLNCQCQTINTPDKAEIPVTTLSNAQRGGGDCADVINRVSVPKQQTVENKNFQENLLDPLALHENALQLAKRTLKYIIFALALIAWSPCIIMILFCWLLTYSLRPQKSHTDLKYKRRSPIKIQIPHAPYRKYIEDNTIQNQNIWESLIKSIHLITKSIATTLNAFKSLIESGNKDDKQVEVRRKISVRNCRTLPSGPNNKYTLYYSRKKGWVMTSGNSQSRNNKRSIQGSRSHLHCVKTNVSCGAAILSHKQCPCGKQRPQLCSKNTRPFIKCPDNNIGLCFPKHIDERHRRMCPCTSRLPIHVELANPEFRYCKGGHSKIPICQQPLRSQTCCCKHTNPKHLRKKSPSPPRTSSLVQKWYKRCKEAKRNLLSVVKDVEHQIWKRDDICCDEAYIYTLRRKPCFFVYKKCPSFYPLCLTTYRFYKNFCHCFLLVTSACIWCPILAFCLMCYRFICKCL